MLQSDWTAKFLQWYKSAQLGTSMGSDVTSTHAKTLPLHDVTKNIKYNFITTTTTTTYEHTYTHSP